MAILAIGKLRDAVNKMVKGNPRSMDFTMTPRMLLGLLDAAEQIGLPAPEKPSKPEWPREVYAKYSGRPRKAADQKQYDALLSKGWVASLAETDKWPIILWLGPDNPNHRIAYNRHELTEDSKDGWAPDETRERPTIHSRPSPQIGSWDAFLLTCDDKALLAAAALHYERSGRSDWQAGHLSDFLSKYYWPDPDETKSE